MIQNGPQCRACLARLISDPNIFVNAQIGRTEGDSSHAAEDWYYYPIKCLSTQSTQWLHLPIYVQIHIKLDQLFEEANHFAQIFGVSDLKNWFHVLDELV